jgi:hypothetical protein
MAARSFGRMLIMSTATVFRFPVRRDVHGEGLAQRTAQLEAALAAAEARVAELERMVETVDADVTTIINALVATGALSVEALRS